MRFKTTHIHSKGLPQLHFAIIVSTSVVFHNIKKVPAKLPKLL